MHELHDSTDRRGFLAGMSATALVTAMHGPLAWSTPRMTRGTSIDSDGDPRILGLNLLTAAPLAEMKRYYHGLLGFAVTDERDDAITLRAGLTSITFTTATKEQGRPFYHFAFNIPEQKIVAARNWQCKRSAVFKTPRNQLDPAYPDDVRHFRNWNAHSVFFFDPAENILEYIARHDLPVTRSMGSAGDGFTAADILYASEIAFVVDEPTEVGATFKAAFELPQYRNGSDQFRAIGDERGLLLVFGSGREIGRGSGTSKRCAVFPTVAVIHGTAAKAHAIDGYPYSIAVK